MVGDFIFFRCTCDWFLERASEMCDWSVKPQRASPIGSCGSEGSLDWFFSGEGKLMIELFHLFFPFSYSCSDLVIVLFFSIFTSLYYYYLFSCFNYV